MLSRQLPTPLLTVLVLAMLLSGCGGGPSSDGDQAVDDVGRESSEQGGEPASTVADRDGTLRIGTVAPVSQWDPHRGRSLGVDYPYYTPVYDTLIELTPSLDLAPMLAHAWEESDDGKTLTFELREDVTFHDGEPFNAAAVVANLQRAQSLEGALTVDQLINVESVAAVDDFTVQISLLEADPSFLYDLATLQAAFMVSPAALEDPDTLATTPSGSGLYRLAEQSTDLVVWERVPGYWETELDSRAPERVEVLFFGDDAARYRALEVGEVDLAVVGGFSATLEAMQDSDEFDDWIVDTSSRTSTMLLNNNREELRNPLVKRAISLALDRQGLQALLGEVRCAATASPFPDPAKFPISADIDAAYERDLDAARALLEEAGVADLEIELLATALPDHIELATAVQAQLGEVGIRVEVLEIAPAEVTGTWLSGDHDAWIISARGYPDPHFTFRDYFYGPTTVGPAPEDFIELAATANGLPLGSQERTAAFDEVGRYLIDEDPISVVVCQSKPAYFASARVLGLRDQSFAQLTGSPTLRYLAVAESS